MPPSRFLSSFSDHIRSRAHADDAHANFAAVKSQWQNPTDILTVLTIIGGDVVQCALAQLSGGSSWRYVTPVAFSFGWVAYSFSAVLSAIGSGKLMPEPELDIKCINVRSGNDREVRSWVLSRLFRDFVPRGEPPRGLTIVFYDTVPDKHTGHRDRDAIYWVGIFVILLQLGIACIPGGVEGNWVILIITVGGILLAQLSGALPQWHDEMWAARKLESDPRTGKVQEEVVCLTAGNGSSHVMVVRSVGCGRKIEDLAGGRVIPSRLTVVSTIALAFLWIAHLMTVQGVQDDGWYLLAIGGIGMVQNVVSAGIRRTPGALGFHIKERRTIHRNKAMEAIQAAEEEEPWVGLRLIETYFPGGLRPHEEEWMKGKKKWYEEQAQANSMQSPGSDTAEVLKGEYVLSDTVVLEK